MVRLFVAVELENADTWRKILEFRDVVASCSIDGGIKPVEDENIHLTLRFIGEVPEIHVPRIIECLNVVRNFKKFSLSLRGVGAFPSVARPRVVWVGVREGAEELRIVRNSFENCLKTLAEEDREEFVPHITVARIKGRYRHECLLTYIRKYELVDFGVSPVTQVKLKKSQLTPKGPIYSDVAVFRLKNDG
ncbi:MAG: RNA 2',3'-cyclic phosphodiesterase [Sulfolobales archaeon]|nr:RNA 2',3'-cyclic phosphodiesterase [Sulfolobales archaeon]MCX8208115.1 RNA 2',3'-cyclic phosphodiesterase [Sulfolobales archaeon]MDW8011039.1 RNA 2',3'-cyclic phosphodiesterase [Sulfolobales archaeon]